ncbi:membrane protein [Gregarina niphandrodes]|uniref:Membrane protein n=1 Tax=Gregarina niphandrodes TaxID=110365 RepID=A0A023B9T7_GRENI|nr:membrane protein [Gregarina niphandrodes]EZG75437.1 membrane protein [Gregarina niphandrodes]|eukprot:XP_011129611.1 membrane protein [Gregarina niphandrodes]
MHTLSGRYDVCWPALAALSAALGDTLASELAPLADAQPKLVTHPWRQVPVGTNGGVTLAGLFLSIVGGWIIGALYALTARAPSIAVFELVVLCGLFGLIGSLIDSLLGALLERDPEERDPEELQRPHERDHSDEKRDGHCDGKRAGPSLWAVLDNDQVNFISTTTAAALASLML